MAGNHVAPIFPGNGPQGGVVTAPVVAPPTGGGGLGDLGQLPGIFLAIKQMEQSRKENQRDREHNLLLTQKQLDAGAALRAAQTENMSAGAALTRAQIAEINKFTDANARILAAQAGYHEARLASFNEDEKERAKTRPLASRMATAETELAETNLGKTKADIDSQKSMAFFNTVDSLRTAIGTAVSAMGGVPKQAHDQAVGAAVAGAMRSASDFMKLRPAGRQYAEQFAKSLDGEGMARHLSDTTTAGMLYGPGGVDPIKMAGAMIFQADLDKTGITSDVGSNTMGASRVLSMTPAALQAAEYAGFTKTKDGQPAQNDPNKPDGPAFGGPAVVNRLFAAHRLGEEAAETLNSTTPESTPLGKTYKSLITKLKYRVENPEGASPDDIVLSKGILRTVESWGIEGFAKRMQVGSEAIKDRLEVLPTYQQLSMPTRVAIREQYHQRVDRLLAEQTQMHGLTEGVSSAAALMLQQKRSDPDRYKMWEATMPPDAPIMRAIKMHEGGASGAALLQPFAADLPQARVVEGAIPGEEAELNEMFGAPYRDFNFSTKGPPTDPRDEGTWRELITRRAREIAPAAALPTPEPAAATQVAPVLTPEQEAAAKYEPPPGVKVGK